MTTITSVVAAVFVRGTTVFVAQRGEGKNVGVSGRKDRDWRTPEQALAREIREELRVNATFGAHITTNAYEYDFGIVNLATY